MGAQAMRAQAQAAQQQARAVRAQAQAARAQARAARQQAHAQAMASRDQLHAQMRMHSGFDLWAPESMASSHVVSTEIRNGTVFVNGQAVAQADRRGGVSV